MDKSFSLIGKRINEVRRSKCISQEKLAELTGLSKSYIYKIEAGCRNLTVQTLLKLAEALEMSVAEMFRDECELVIDERVQLLFRNYTKQEAEFLFYMLKQYEEARKRYLNNC